MPPPPGADFGGFNPAALRFLRSLARHNTREWFTANRPRYETFVRGPLAALVEEMDVRFARAAPEIVGEPKRSIFRIHRDVRFSRDKSPYKTHAACWFYHQDAGRQVGQDAEGGSAGFYFHLQPGASFLGAGLWMPPRSQLARIRDALLDDHRGLARRVLHPAVRRRFGRLDEDGMLTRAPRGYPPEHPAGPWLRYTSFTMGRALGDREVLSPRLPATLERDYARLLPLVRWLNGALGYGRARRA